MRMHLARLLLTHTNKNAHSFASVREFPAKHNECSLQIGYFVYECVSALCGFAIAFIPALRRYGLVVFTTVIRSSQTTIFKKNSNTTAAMTKKTKYYRFHSNNISIQPSEQELFLLCLCELFHLQSETTVRKHLLTHTEKARQRPYACVHTWRDRASILFVSAVHSNSNCV